MTVNRKEIQTQYIRFNLIKTMEAIPKQVRKRLELMTLADLDILAETCGKAAESSKNMGIRVAWISAVMAERISEVFDIK